jgi:hypothetical protein
MDFAELSRTLLGMSVKTFLRHPHLYLASVAQSAVLFWFPAPYYEGYSIGEFFRGQCPWWVYLYAGVYLVMVITYIAFVLGACLWRRLRHVVFSGGMLIVQVAILYAWFTSSLVEFGENARYKFPVEGLLFGVVFTVFVSIVSVARASDK